MKCLVFVTYNYLIIEFDRKQTSPFVLVSSGYCKKIYRKKPILIEPNLPSAIKTKSFGSL